MGGSGSTIPWSASLHTPSPSTGVYERLQLGASAVVPAIAPLLRGAALASAAAAVSAATGVPPADESPEELLSLVGDWYRWEARRRRSVAAAAVAVASSAAAAAAAAATAHGAVAAAAAPPPAPFAGEATRQRATVAATAGASVSSACDVQRLGGGLAGGGAEGGAGGVLEGGWACGRAGGWGGGMGGTLPARPLTAPAAEGRCGGGGTSSLAEQLLSACARPTEQELLKLLAPFEAGGGRLLSSRELVGVCHHIERLGGAGDGTPSVSPRG